MMQLPSTGIVMVCMMMMMTLSSCDQSLPWGDKIKKLTEFKMIAKIKQQILRNLDLSTRPTSSPVLPDNDVSVPNNTKRTNDINELISFSEPPDTFEDEKIIQFRLAKDIRGRRVMVKSASLVIRVKQRRRSGKKRRFKAIDSRIERRAARRGSRVSLAVSTVNHDGNPEDSMATVRSRIRKNKWFKVNLNQSLMQRTVDSSNGTVLLHVQCNGCKRNTYLVLVHSARKRKRQLKKSKTKRLRLNKGRPFLILHTFVDQELNSSHPEVQDFRGRWTNRQRRSTGSGCWIGSARCCRRQLYVNFTDIGWNDWILSPPGFTTAECFGSCNHGNRASEQSVQCGPTRRRPLRLFYRNGHGDYVRESLPNFIVSRCGCAGRKRQRAPV